MGGNNTWRLRVRLMLIIPAVLLPITIIFIAICRSDTNGKISHEITHNENEEVRGSTSSIKGTENNVLRFVQSLKYFISFQPL